MAAPTENGQSTSPPSFDLQWSPADLQFDQHPDSRFLYRRLEEVLLEEGSAPGGELTLDVACGTGGLVVGVRVQGGGAIGLDPSSEMLALNRLVFPGDDSPLVRGIAEALPFRDEAFSRVVCRASLDHFIDPHIFMQEAARVLEPGGRVVIALANYKSLSCRLGHFRHRLARVLRRRRGGTLQPYWEPPADHHHKGDPTFIRRLGGPSLRLERCTGISLMRLAYNWGDLLERLPPRLVGFTLRTLDWLARRAPGLADIIVSIWRPSPGVRSTAVGNRPASQALGPDSSR